MDRLDNLTIFEGNMLLIFSINSLINGLFSVVVGQLLVHDLLDFLDILDNYLLARFLRRDCRKWINFFNISTQINLIFLIKNNLCLSICWFIILVPTFLSKPPLSSGNSCPFTGFFLVVIKLEPIKCPPHPILY